MKVDGWNNFCRVFELPESYPEDFCFNGGHLTSFKIVDWFNPVPELGTPAISKEKWIEKYQTLSSMEKEIDFEELEKSIVSFLRQKVYIKHGRKYLVLYEFNKATVFVAN